MTPSLAQRIAVTIGALLLYRLGQYIPLPGVDPVAWEMIFRSQQSGMIGVTAALSGVRRVSIFALDIVPYISAAVILQLTTIVSRRLRALARAGERGRVCMVRAALYLTVVLTVFQAWGIASALERVGGVVTNPGPLFVLSTIVTLTGGTIFLAWLAQVIAARGFGNGIAVILLAGIVTQLPASLAASIEVIRQGVLSTEQVGALVLVMLAITAVIVPMELACRRVPIRYAGTQVGLRIFDEQQSDLVLKLNPAGIVPVLLASFVLSMLIFVAGLLAGFESGLVAHLRPGTLTHLILYALLIIVCTFFYTASVLDPEEAAESLGRFRGFVPGVLPGAETAAYLDRVVSRTTVLGAAYLVSVIIAPEILIYSERVPFYFGGIGLLVVVCTIIDLAAQWRAWRFRP